MNTKRSISNKKLPSHTKGDVQRRKAGGDSPAGRPITGWRLWLFRIIAITVVPALLFLLLEITLRIVGYGFPTTATIKCEVNGRVSYCDNVKFGWRFFPRNIARSADPFIFPADKPDDTYRIFVLGASAAQGVPDAAFGFGRILRVMLQQEYPGVNFELITIAMPAINSHVILDAAKDCARHEPDLFVVYLGNNEVVGPYGAGTVFAPLSSNLSLIRFGIALKTTRVGQLITSFALAATRKDTPQVWHGMEMFLGKQVRADDPRLKTVYQHFERNLKDISQIARRSRAKIIFCTVGSNLKDNPPFASLHRQSLTETEKKKWDDIYRQGIDREEAGDYAEAAELYLAAAEIDDCYADLQFRLGRCYWAMAEYDKAKDRYIKARQLDTLRFRADSRINEIIRTVADGRVAEDVYLIDAAKAFEENSPYGIAGEELFYEHVHLNFKGNYLLAKTVFEQAEKILPEPPRLLVEEKSGGHKADERPLSTEAECARHLAYTDWDRYNVTYNVLNAYIKRAPFTNRLYNKQQVSRMEQKLKALEIYLSPESLKNSAAEYSGAIQIDGSDWWLRWKYGKLLSEDLKNPWAAVEQYRFLAAHFPHSHLAYAELGLLSGEQGRLDESIAYNLEALRIMPTYADAHYHLGLAYQMQGRLDKSIEHYFKAIQLQPEHKQAYSNLGALLYKQGKLDQAVKTCRKGLLFLPDDPVLHLNLGILLKTQGHRDEAIKELRAALRIDPNSVKIRKVLEAIQY
ncbi:MAG: tetratricopeptide repeat protein [Planctomycetes bacterium]|nr:tetratricopeptide repeat protein [Planctomycetota bacterium]MBU2457428.1 tetratricopeptide repeat protein [Planctomycetota bacterium]